MRDAWTVGGRGPGHTHPSTGSRIDHVLTSRDVEVLSAEVLVSDASDHLPVLVNLLLPGG